MCSLLAISFEYWPDPLIDSLFGMQSVGFHFVNTSLDNYPFKIVGSSFLVGATLVGSIEFNTTLVCGIWFHFDSSFRLCLGMVSSLL